MAASKTTKRESLPDPQRIRQAYAHFSPRALDVVIRELTNELTKMKAKALARGTATAAISLFAFLI